MGWQEPHKIQRQMESPSRTWADWSAAAAQAWSWLPGIQFCRKSPGVLAGTKLSVGQQRALVVKDRVTAKLQIARREKGFAAFWYLRELILCTVFSFEQPRTRRSSPLLYWSKLAGSPPERWRSWNARCKQKTGAGTRIVVSSVERRGLWEIILQSSITWQVAVEGVEPAFSWRCSGRMRSNKYHLEHEKFLLDERKKVFTLRVIEPWRSRKLN